MSIGDGIQLGYTGYLGYAQEATYGTRVAPSTFMEFTSEGLQLSIDEYLYPTINTQRGYLNRFQGNRSVGGSIDFPFNPVSSAQLWFHIIGGTYTVAGTANSGYTHTWTPTNNNLPGGNGSVTSLTLSVRRGTTDVFDYVGCKVASFTLKGNVGEPITATMEIIGKDCTVGAGTTTSYTTILPFTFRDVTYRTADSVASLTSTAVEKIMGFEMTVNNNLVSDNNVRSLGQNTVNTLAPGLRDVTLNLTQRYDTTTAYTKFAANTKVVAGLFFYRGLTCGAGAGGTTYSMYIKFPAMYCNGQGPAIGGPEALIQDLAFRCMADSITGSDVNVTLCNATAVYNS